ncbi:MAG: hypothetical protein ACRCVJ_16515 [Clostridium sp.]
MGYCPHCGKYFRYPKRRMTNSNYEDKESNYTYECKECFDRTIEYFQNMWDDYNSGRY